MPGIGAFHHPPRPGLQRLALGADRIITDQLIQQVTGFAAVVAGVQVYRDSIGHQVLDGFELFKGWTQQEGIVPVGSGDDAADGKVLACLAEVFGSTWSRVGYEISGLRGH